jgi:hypothetical protein
MKGISVDPEARTVRAEAGLTWDPSNLLRHNRNIPPAT